MSSWRLVENPDYADKMPRKLTPACHDRSPFLTIRCNCGSEMHVHETQVLDVDGPIGTKCVGCGDVLAFPPRFFGKAFAELRLRGWIDARGA